MRLPRRQVPIAAALLMTTAAILVAACSGTDDPRVDAPDISPVAAMTSCGTRTDFFTVSPIAFNDFYGWVPLGNLSTPLHTFPTAHQYLFHTLASGALHTVPVVSPGDIVIVKAARRVYTATGRNDYTLQFAVCREVTGYFNHMATVDAAIIAKFLPFDQTCFASSAGEAYSDCTTRYMSIPVATGAPVGRTGGVAGLLAWDFGLRDARVSLHYANPARWDRESINGDFLHVVAASDYYAEPARSQIAARLGRSDGTQRRTQAPLGGTIDVDVTATAQGMWFNTAQLVGTEGPHLAIVPDNIDPTEFAMSGSESLAGYTPSVGYWRPTATGLTNPAPSTIIADGQIRCLNLFNGRSVLLRLENATTLRVEARPAGVNCTLQLPWAFSASAFDFHR
jgi:hypothetical protein